VNNVLGGIQNVFTGELEKEGLLASDKDVVGQWRRQFLTCFTTAALSRNFGRSGLRLQTRECLALVLLAVASCAKDACTTTNGS
jgi:hypothetical protein